MTGATSSAARLLLFRAYPYLRVGAWQMPRHQHTLHNAAGRRGPARRRSIPRVGPSISSDRRGTSRRAALPARRRLGIVLPDAEPRQRRRGADIRTACRLLRRVMSNEPPRPCGIPDHWKTAVRWPPGRAGTCVAAEPNRVAKGKRRPRPRRIDARVRPRGSRGGRRCPRPAADVGPGQVRVQLEGSGVCASSLPEWEGRPWFTYPSNAGEPGHKEWGVVDEIGEGVESSLLGSRVASVSTQRSPNGTSSTRRRSSRFRPGSRNALVRVRRSPARSTPSIAPA